MRTLGARSIASVVKAENAASRAAHEACGFTDTGKTAKDAEGNVIKNCLIYQYHFSG
jgi:L-amino acid N-acyltransferase YncA